MNCADFEQIDMLEAKDLLLKEGSISIVIEEKYKSRFKSCCKRIDRLERLLRSNSTIKMAWYYIYSVYVSIINTFLTLNCNPLDHAIDVYMVSWKNIGNLHGESIGNGKFKITYNKRI